MIEPDGAWHVIVTELREEALAAFRRKQATGTVTPDDFTAAAGETLRFPSSVCFTGPDRRTVVLGSLAMDRLPTFRSPVGGRLP